MADGQESTPQANLTQLTTKYQEILSEHGISDKISKLTVSAPDLKGEHMGSMIELVKIEFENCEEREPMDFFVKKKLPAIGMPPGMAEKMSKIVLNEGFFLKDFSLEMKQLCEERVGSSALIDGLLPKTYYYDGDMIVMENLIKKGYINLSKHDRQDFDHAKLVLENLARLHGVGYVLIQKEGGYEKFIEKRPDFEESFLKPETGKFISKMFEPSYGLTLQVLKSSKHPEKEKVYKILEKYQGQLTSALLSAFTSETLFHVINHPDCWNNNIMFEGRGPEHDKLIFVDFQLLRSGSPNLDISYFIFTSTKAEVRKRWRELLKIYFDRLSQIIQALGQPFDVKFEDFVSDFVRKSKFGFFFGLFGLLGWEAMGGHDAEAGAGFTEDVFTNLITKWINANPVKAQQVSEEMVFIVHDYLLFGEL